MKKYFSKKQLFIIITLISLFIAVISVFPPDRIIKALPVHAQTTSANTYPGNLTGKFQEIQLYQFDSSQVNLPQVYGYFINHQNSQTQTSTKTAFLENTPISFPDANTIKIRALSGVDPIKTGIIINNPAKDKPFYKITFTMIDERQDNITSAFTITDLLWGQGTTVHGLSIGLNPIGGYPDSYWYDHTGFKSQSQITPHEWEFDTVTKSKIQPRIRTAVSNDIEVEIYHTPIGIYGTVDGANYATFPQLYSGNNILPPQKINYLVFGRWGGNQSVSIKNIRIFELDNSIANVNEVSAHFAKKAMDKPEITAKINLHASGNYSGATLNEMFSEIILLRTYDFYFKTDSILKIQKIIDGILPLLKQSVAGSVTFLKNANTYGIDGTMRAAFFQGFMSNQGFMWFLMTMMDYLRPDQIQQLHEIYAPLVDASQSRLTTSPPGKTFPEAEQFKGDSSAEELAWITQFYSSFVNAFPYDYERINRTLEFIQYIGFHTLNEGKTLQEVYGNTLAFKYLDDSYPVFRHKSIYPDGKLDNNGPHPSAHYAEGAVALLAVADNFLKKAGINLEPNTLRRNTDFVYNNSIKDFADPNTLRLKLPLQYWSGDQLVYIEDDYGMSTTGAVLQWGWGHTKPSLTEVWFSLFSNYSAHEEYGDYTDSWLFGHSAYYLLHSGTGFFGCSSALYVCNFSSKGINLYFMGAPFATFTASMRSTFSLPNLKGKYTSWKDTAGSDLSQIPFYKDDIKSPCYGKGVGQCFFSTRTTYHNLQNRLNESITIGPLYYNWSEDIGWWSSSGNDLASVDRYKESNLAPCYGKTAGQCNFTTRTLYYNHENKLYESITVGAKVYNWTEGLGWWNNNGTDLTSIARYKENSDSPCYNKPAGQCVFTSRSIHKNQLNRFIETVIIGPKIYVYDYNTNFAAPSRWYSNIHDPAADPRYNDNRFAPCFGLAVNACPFTSLSYHYENDKLIESVIIGTKLYTWVDTAIYEPTLAAQVPGDTNGDKAVNFTDFMKLLSRFGLPAYNAYTDADFNNDNVTDITDANIQISNYGK